MEINYTFNSLAGSTWKNNATTALIEITKDMGDGRVQYKYYGSVGGFYISKELLQQYFTQELLRATA